MTEEKKDTTDLSPEALAKGEEKDSTAKAPADVKAEEKTEAPKADAAKDKAKTDDKSESTAKVADAAKDKAKTDDKSESTAKVADAAKDKAKTDDKKTVTKSTYNKKDEKKSSGSGGQQGSPFKRRKRISEYGQQLIEKQSAKKIYGIRERQFRNYYKKALGSQGDTGDILRQLLQMRLDNVIYQSGLAKTTRSARQMVSHNFFLVNGKKVNIPSYQVKIKDVITIKPTKVDKKVWGEEAQERIEEKEVPSWLTLDKKTKELKVTAKPVGDELDQSFSPRLIVEFYSR